MHTYYGNLLQYNFIWNIDLWLAGTFRCEFSKESTRATLMSPETKGFDISRSNSEQPPSPRPSPPLPPPSPPSPVPLRLQESPETSHRL
ncbi:hypothetical protein Mapa_004530 [Marchantia paleacea]|nr:hypothetical protein Mapa_004530 [Marchantia paleacea]